MKQCNNLFYIYNFLQQIDCFCHKLIFDLQNYHQYETLNSITAMLLHVISIISWRSDYIIFPNYRSKQILDMHGLLHQNTIHTAKFKGKQHAWFHRQQVIVCLRSFVDLWCFSFKLCRMYCVQAQ